MLDTLTALKSFENVENGQIESGSGVGTINKWEKQNV